MDDFEINGDLSDAASHVRHLSRRIALDPHHKLRLREELLRRHQELSADRTQRAAGTLWSRLTGPRRLTLVAPPALAIVLALILLLGGVPFPRNSQQQQTAEAATLARVITNTVPTVVHWQWTVTREIHGKVTTNRLEFPLRPLQRIYISHHRVYLYDRGNWLMVRKQVPSAGSDDWQWAFATLALRLSAGKGFTILPARRMNGERVLGIRYGVSSQRKRQTMATAWVDAHSGLMVRLDRVVRAGGKPVERDRVEYTYKRVA